MDTLVILAVAVFLLAVTVLPYHRRTRRREDANRQRLERSRAAGLDEPPSLHPVVDPAVCLGSGACVAACPEGDILGLIHGRPVLLNASRCVGHGQCAAACPVSAITLVFGTARRGVDIPHVQGTFETNVAGVYIVGELGGMGLIRNALRQGRQAVEGIARQGRGTVEGEYDLVVAGAGPAGLAASLTALEHGLRCRSIEQDAPGGAVRHYPRQKLVMTEPMEIPLYGRVPWRQASKEQLLELWDDVLRRTGLRLQTGERLLEARRDGDHLVVSTTAGEYRTRNLVLAIGRRGTPNRLEVPGEELAKVAYRLLEPEQYEGEMILIVVGGNSALETACALAHPERRNTVTLAHRGQAFSRAREENRARVDALSTTGRLTVLLDCRIRRIHPDAVDVVVGAEERVLANHHVFVCAGGSLPTELLGRLGVSIERKFGEA